uniref:LIM homeobox transcription factor 1-beta n=1 Tax=Timema shepardi TaxID=629360 RepID=A0A7R9FVE5_TIMSH|nr:unnamed protein product [Timema shepardi]
MDPGAVKCEKTYEVCEGCGQKIHDRFLMRVADSSWHEHCLACCECGVLLNHSCYCRNAKLYCKADYDRKFGVKCSRCGDRLLPHEMVMRAQSHVFHLQCFVCVVCCQPLQKGEQFVLRAGQLFCRQDFEKEMYLMQASPSGRVCSIAAATVLDSSSAAFLIFLVFVPVRRRTIDKERLEHVNNKNNWRENTSERAVDHIDVTDTTGYCLVDLTVYSKYRGDDLLDENSRPRDGRRGPKRPRTILTSAQRRQFKLSFEISPKPCRKVMKYRPKRLKRATEAPFLSPQVREALAKDTGLSVRVVQVWFQNQRAKMKKLQRKAKQEADNKSSSGEKEKDGKEDKVIKQEPLSSDHKKDCKETKWSNRSLCPATKVSRIVLSSSEKDCKETKWSNRSFFPTTTVSPIGNHYLGLNGLGQSDNSYTPTSSQPLNPNIPYSPDDTYPMHSGDSLCSSDISLDDSTNFEQMDEGGSDTLSLQNLDMQSHSVPPDRLLPGMVQVNPIDKLYLMQNSYFNTEQ